MCSVIGRDLFVINRFAGVDVPEDERTRVLCFFT
jgi:hypothetical protein